MWDGDEPLAQVDTSGNVIGYWCRADQPLPEGKWSRLVKAGVAGPFTQAQYLHADCLGTVVATSNASGVGVSHSGSSPRSWGDGDNPTMAPLSWQGNHGYWAENQLARPMHYVRDERQLKMALPHF